MKTYREKIGGSEFKLIRLQDETPTLSEGATMECPENAVTYLREKLATSICYRPDVENLIVLLLTTRRKTIGFEIISQGTIDMILCHPREVFRSAIIANAAGIVIAHNHPSGDPTPSEADIKVTRDMIRAGQLMKIDVCDHLILGRQSMERAKDFSSLRELGYFSS